MHLLRIWWLKFPCWESVLRSLVSYCSKNLVTEQWRVDFNHRKTDKRQCSFVTCMHSCEEPCTGESKDIKSTGWAVFTHLWRGIFCFGGDEEINHFAQGSAVVLQQRQEPRGWISRFLSTYLSQRFFSKLQLASTEYATLFFNFTSPFGYSAVHVRHNVGQDWVCRHAAQTPQQRCLLWPQPGHVSVNGKSPVWQSGLGFSYTSRISIGGWQQYGWSEVHYRFQSCW